VLLLIDERCLRNFFVFDNLGVLSSGVNGGVGIFVSELRNFFFVDDDLGVLVLDLDLDFERFGLVGGDVILLLSDMKSSMRVVVVLLLL